MPVRAQDLSHGLFLRLINVQMRESLFARGGGFLFHFILIFATLEHESKRYSNARRPLRPSVLFNAWSDPPTPPEALHLPLPHPLPHHLPSGTYRRTQNNLQVRYYSNPRLQPCNLLFLPCVSCIPRTVPLPLFSSQALIVGPRAFCESYPQFSSTIQQVDLPRRTAVASF